MARRVNKQDTQADVDLRKLLEKRNSFVMVAGAGSGKTTSLIKALDYLRTTYGKDLKRNKQKIACITYTTGAEKEILEDVDHDQIFHVSTIHSFLWEITRPFQVDIQQWVINRIAQKIEELKVAAAEFGPRVQQKTRDKNASDQLKFSEQLEVIKDVTKFTYGTASDFAEGILGHSDIIKMACTLIDEKPILRKIISNRFPFIFVDESQDTLPELVSALIAIDCEFPETICIGFFGDPMQRIYTSGVGSIALAEGWKQVSKPENFRCSTEVLEVINNLRAGIDTLQQEGGKKIVSEGRVTPVVGSAHLFVLPADDFRNGHIAKVKAFLSKKLSDPLWLADEKADVDIADLKMLMIEHRMAAIRLGFPNLFSAFKDNGNESLSAAFTEGNSWPLRPFQTFVLPLVEAYASGKNFRTIELLRLFCPKLTKIFFADNQKKPADVIKELRVQVAELSALCANDSSSTVGDIVKFLASSDLYAFDEKFRAFLNGTSTIAEEVGVQEENSLVFKLMLDCPFSELFGYQTYINDESPYSTQHSVKGSEFERVMVILDDEEGKKSTLYSYEKFFGVKELSKNDNDNIASGKETVIDRTRRLLYVCCSRAMTDLAVLFFVADVEGVYKQVSDGGIFKRENILTMDQLK